MVSWWVHSGRTYYLEGTSDLESGEWENMLSVWPSYLVGEYSHQVTGSFTGNKFFFRVRYIEGRRMALNHNTFADPDHDGVSDLDEMNGVSVSSSGNFEKTHPLKSEDSDSDGLPDDWEKRYFHLIRLW